MYKMNPKYIGEVLKDTDEVFVYLNPAYPGEICKKHNLVRTNKEEKKAFNNMRTKSLDIKNNKNWPKFIIKPTNVGRMNKECFTVRYPFIEGMTIAQYIKSKDITLIQCAQLLKKLEDSLISAEDFVFTDIGNPSNTIIRDDDMNFTVIDPDNVLFDKYKDAAISDMVAPLFQDVSRVYGMNKCKRYSSYNKQLELRSMYALLYYMMNGDDRFYPPLLERDSISEYEQILQSLNIPENSDLYRKSMITLNNRMPNERIGESLIELIEDGYTFETYDKDNHGYKHILRKK